ncbi:MAG TPA: L-fucokinase, partial [Vicinamibacteria bacterium]|nr:L-fucokinase [Vicinamibacteria bacterium]
MHLFDTVLVTASSEPQAEAFRALVRRRLEHGLYPRELQFEVVADPPGGRVGTGGSTLWALRALLQRRGGSAEALFSRERLLLIHAGGESRRLPCYAPEGKLFSPLPLASSALLPPVVLDAQLALFCKYPWRRGEVVIASGDAVIDFDTGGLPEPRSAVFGFATPAPPERGARHGVFRFDQRRERVLDYFQKAPVERLVREALLEGTADCALDIGLVSLSPQAVAAFLDLGDSVVEGGSVLQALGCGRLRFDLYLEVLTACLEDLSFEGFWERVSGTSALPRELAWRLHQLFHPLGLGGTVTRSTVFEHVGSLGELPAASLALVAQRVLPFYEADGGELRPQASAEWVIDNCADVRVTATGPGQPSLVEGCAGCTLSLAGDNVVVGLDGLSFPINLPRGFTLDGRQLPQGQVVVVLAAGDSLKPERDEGRVVFCAQPLQRWLAERGLTRDDVWSASDSGRDLFEARLFAIDPEPSFLRGYLEPDPAWGARFRAARRLSLAEVNAADDAVRREDRRVFLRRQRLRESFRAGRGWRELSVDDFTATFASAEWREPLHAWLARTDDALLRAYRERLFRAIAGGAVPPAAPAAIDYVPRPAEPTALVPALKEDQIVWARAPVRLDLAG